MSDDGAEIIELFSTAEKAKQNAPVIDGKRKPYCAHDRVELDSTNRRAYCRDCKDEVDVFDFLLRLSQNFRVYVDSWQHANREAKAATARLEELKRQERNIKSRIRAGAKKLDLKRCDRAYFCEHLVLSTATEGGGE